jgi:hypothetical protein
MDLHFPTSLSVPEKGTEDHGALFRVRTTDILCKACAASDMVRAFSAENVFSSIQRSGSSDGGEERILCEKVLRLFADPGVKERIQRACEPRVPLRTIFFCTMTFFFLGLQKKESVREGIPTLSF